VGPAGVGAQRHHKPQPGGIGGAQPAQVAEPGVGYTDDPGWGQLAQALQRSGHTRCLVGRARVGPVVDHDPGAGGCLQGLDLAGDTAIGRPPLFHQRRAVVAAGEPHCGHIQVQPRQVGPAAGRGGQRQLAADLLGHRSQRLQRPAQPVVVEQTRRHAEQFGHRRRGGPAGHVIQRRRRAEPVGHQRGDHLPVGQHRLPAHRHRVIDELDQAQPIQVVGHQQQRPNVAAGAHRWRIQPGERRRQLLQLARRLQLVLAAQRAQYPVAHPALGVPIRCDQAQVHVASAASDHRVAFNVHAGPIPVPSGWPYTIPLQAALQPCDSVCLRNHGQRDLALHDRVMRRSAGGANHTSQNPILNSRYGLPQPTARPKLAPKSGPTPDQCGKRV
jgi:hypothetical protein